MCNSVVFAVTCPTGLVAHTGASEVTCRQIIKTKLLTLS